MALPKRKKSKSKRDMRRANDHVKLPQTTLCPQCHEPVLPHHIDHVKLPQTTLCPQCHEPVLPHHICPHCGIYRGRTLIKTEES